MAEHGAELILGLVVDLGFGLGFEERFLRPLALGDVETGAQQV